MYLSVHLMLSINLVRVGLTSLVVICSGVDLIRLLDIASQSIGLSDIYSEREGDIHADRNSRFWLDYLITGNYSHYMYNNYREFLFPLTTS